MAKTLGNIEQWLKDVPPVFWDVQEELLDKFRAYEWFADIGIGVENGIEYISISVFDNVNYPELDVVRNEYKGIPIQIDVYEVGCCCT